MRLPLRTVEDCSKRPRGLWVGALMIPPRCLVLAAVLCAAANAPAQTPAPATFPIADERAAKLAERYKAMLAANPSEGIALDRLWKIYEDHDATAALVDEYRQAAERGGSAARLIYGHLLQKTGRFDAAAAEYAAAGQAEPANPLPLLARAEVALAGHHPEDAASLFGEALGLLPSNDHRRADLLQKQGNAWLAAGQPVKAAQTWEQLIAADPANLALHKQLADTYARNGLVDRALAHLEYLDQHAEPAARAAALREMGRLHEARGEFDAAREAYERGLALTARDNWLHGELLGAIIRLYERAGRVAELEARWRLAAEQAPRDLGGYLRLETLAESQGDARGELEWLDRISALAPRDRASRLKLARLLVDRGQRDRAAAVYDQLLKEQPDQLDLILARADLDLQMGASEAAVRRVEARLAKNPADETVSTSALEFFLGRHLDEPAERCLRAAAARPPGSLDAGIALAKFYFARRRPDDGRRVLDGLTGEAGGSATALDRWQRVAAAFKDENLPDDALRCWQQAARLAPNDPVPLEAASELLLARGEPQAAADALETAVAVVPEGPAREEVEHKLFQVLSVPFENAPGRTEGAGPPTGTPRRRPRGTPPSLPTSGLALPVAGNAVAVAVDGPLDRYLGKLEDAAGRQPTTVNLLRLARWQLWARSLNEAADSAEKAVAREPANLPARQLLIRVATEAHEHEVAGRQLREIIALDPAHRLVYQRQLAGLQMEDGDFDAAIVGYSQLQEAQPGSVEPLTDLALAQQRAERWFDALATWKRAYALPSLTPAQRGDVRRPLIAAYEHLGEFRPAAEMLAHAVDEQPDLARQQELFQELSEFCRTHALGDWLAGRYEARLQAQPEDYFTMVAVAGLWKNQGRDEEAYGLLRRAYFSAPDPVAALKSLAEEAAAVGEDDQAVTDHRRLAGIVGQDTPENLAKLAAAEEDALDEEEAARTWERIAARFPRDTNALAQAADFFERIGKPDQARALLGRVIAIEPADLPRLFHLAELARDAGDEADAREKFGQVLARSTAEKPGGPLRLPPDLEAAPEPSVTLGGLGVFYRSPAAEPPPLPAAGADDGVLRLRAIRELAALLPGRDDPRLASEARNRWLEPWRKAAAAGARSEPLQAFYAAGDVAGTMDLLAGWMEARPTDEPLRRAFLLAGLRLGDYGRLARWTWPAAGTDPSGARGLQLVAAVQQFLAAGGRPGPKITAELFPAHVQARELLWKTVLWRTAEGFAERRWYAPAAELGERVLALAASNHSAYAVDLAQWELFLDRPDRARAALRAALDEGGGVSFDGASTEGVEGSGVYEALRAYYLLLPADERAGFVDGYLRGWQARGQVVHGVLSAVLLHGLQGDETSARRDLDTLLALGLAEPGSASADHSLEARRWSYVLGAGVQLETWSLGPLAAYLWRQALRAATAFDRRDGEVQGMLAEISNRLVVLEVATATDPETSRERVSEYLGGHPRADLVRPVAAQWLSASQFPAARQLYESLSRQEPGNEEDWRNLLAADNAEGALDDMETALVSLLGPDRVPPSPLTRAELVRDLAALRQFEGDDTGALRLLEREFQDGNRAAPVITSLAAFYERAGLLDEAARVWQEGIAGDYGNARTYRLALARLAERRGDLPQAISWLEAELAGKGPPGAEAAVGQLAGLYLRTGRADQARDLALGLLRTNGLEALPGVAQAFAQAGQQPLLRDWLRTAVRRTHDPQTRFQLQQQLLEKDLASPGESATEFARAMRRLKKFSQAAPALPSAYETARYTLARQHGANHWLEGELQREWREGRGEFAAGEQLVSLYLDTRQTEPLRRVIQAIDARPNLPEQSLASIEKRLTDADLAGMALPLSERLFRRFPQNELYGLGRAKVLWKTGQTAEADRLLEALDGSAFFREDLSARIGALYEELGEAERARAFYVRAVQRDPSGVRSAAVCLRLAQIEARRKNLPEVRRLLQIAYRHPAAANDLTPLVDFLQASGELGGNGPRGLPGGEFPLTFTKRGQLLTLVYQRLKTLGRLPEAQAMVAAHPGFLAASPALAAAWRQDAKSEQVPEFIALLEDAAGLPDGPTPRLGRDLAALYVRWSDDEANADPREAAMRLDHLARAQRFAPDDFEVARRLAALCWENHQPDRATAALQPFLASDAVPAEREQARALLARH